MGCILLRGGAHSIAQGLQSAAQVLHYVLLLCIGAAFCCAGLCSAAQGLHSAALGRCYAAQRPSAAQLLHILLGGESLRAGQS